jgi:hypothetical protein
MCQCLIELESSLSSSSEYSSKQPNMCILHHTCQQKHADDIEMHKDQNLFIFHTFHSQIAFACRRHPIKRERERDMEYRMSYFSRSVLLMEEA